MPVTPTAPRLAIAWCGDPGMADAITGFFVAHVDAAYISHQELQEGRALAPGSRASSTSVTASMSFTRSVMALRVRCIWPGNH